MKTVKYQLFLISGFRRLVCNSVQLQVLVSSTIHDTHGSYIGHMTCGETEPHSRGSDGNHLVSWNLPNQTPVDRGAKH